MNVRTASGIPRNAFCRFANLRHASSSLHQPLQHANSSILQHGQTPYSYQPQLKLEPQPLEHGRHIWVYQHIQTNQVIYSLTRALDNKAALEQIPYNGKKTVPSALRKDLWHPMATISFMPGAGNVGLSTFQKLREYRRIHETSWDESLMYDEDNKGLQKLVPKKKRGRKIMDQKANSVADIATVLRKVGTPEGDAIGLQGTAEGLEDASRVEVRWSNLLDAEFAETWSENVVHDKLDWSKNNRGLHDLSKAQVDRLKDGKQLIEQWRAMTPDEKVDLAVEKFGAAILEEKERPRREYEQKQAALKAEWQVNGGAPRVLSPEEKAERQRVAEERILKKEEARKAEEDMRMAAVLLKEEKQRTKEALKEEKRLAYAAEQATKRAEWLASLDPEEAAEIEKLRDEKRLASDQQKLHLETSVGGEGDDAINLPNSIDMAERKAIQEEKATLKAAELEKSREAKRLAKKASRDMEKERHRIAEETRLAHEANRAKKQAELRAKTGEFQAPYPAPADRTKHLEKQMKLQKKVIPEIRKELLKLVTPMITKVENEKAEKQKKDRKEIVTGQTRDDFDKKLYVAQLSKTGPEERLRLAEKEHVWEMKRKAYEEAQAKSREDWLAAGAQVKPKNYPPKSPEAIHLADEKQRIREEKRYRTEEIEQLRKKKERRRIRRERRAKLLTKGEESQEQQAKRLAYEVAYAKGRAKWELAQKGMIPKEIHETVSGEAVKGRKMITKVRGRKETPDQREKRLAYEATYTKTRAEWLAAKNVEGPKEIDGTFFSGTKAAPKRKPVVRLAPVATAVKGFKGGKASRTKRKPFVRTNSNTSSRHERRAGKRLAYKAEQTRLHSD